MGHIRHLIATGEWALSGNRRFRASDRMSGYHKREAIVLLQVEEHRPREFDDASWDVERRWRDATPDDLLRTIKPD